MLTKRCLWDLDEAQGNEAPMFWVIDIFVLDRKLFSNPINFTTLSSWWRLCLYQWCGCWAGDSSVKVLRELCMYKHSTQVAQSLDFVDIQCLPLICWLSSQMKRSSSYVYHVIYERFRCIRANCLQMHLWHLDAHAKCLLCLLDVGAAFGCSSPWQWDLYCDTANSTETISLFGE